MQSGEKNGFADESRQHAQQAVSHDAPKLINDPARDKPPGPAGRHRQREHQRPAHGGAVQAAEQAERKAIPKSILVIGNGHGEFSRSRK